MTVSPKRAASEQSLWRDYWDSQSAAHRNRLVEHYLPLVRSAAFKLKSRLPKSVEFDDLCSFCLFGLMEAIDGFRPELGVKFETFSAFRIYGAMIDGLRSIDRVPRSVRSRAKRLDAAIDQLTCTLGRQPREEEVADAMGLTLQELWEYSQAAHQSVLVSLDDSLVSEGGGDEDVFRLSDVLAAPETDVARRARSCNWWRMARAWLKPNERRVLWLYYWRGWTMAQIGKRIGKSESRVSQMHDHICLRLRGRMGGTEDELEPER
jgi:RNA polymerase sigma factor for flagellar operon FliA